MLNVTYSKDELLELIRKNVHELMEENRENFNKANQVMTPMSSQIAVLATIQTLSQLGFLNIHEPTHDSKN